MRILVLLGHPDPSPSRFGRALAEAYADGARLAGHEVDVLDLARLELPLLRSRADWEAPAPADVLAAQQKILSCAHLAVFFPLWLGEAPALVKAFLEQALRPGFALGSVSEGRRWEKLLNGRSVRLVVTMGMPAFVYRWFYRAHGLKSLERNVLRFCGLGPVATTLIGNVEGCGDAARQGWLQRMEELGRAGR